MLPFDLNENGYRVFFFFCLGGVCLFLGELDRLIEVLEKKKRSNSKDTLGLLPRAYLFFFCLYVVLWLWGWMCLFCWDEKQLMYFRGVDVHGNFEESGDVVPHARL